MQITRTENKRQVEWKPEVVRKDYYLLAAFNNQHLIQVFHVPSPYLLSIAFQF